MKIGVFGRGRLGGAFAKAAGDRVVWQVGREPLAGRDLAAVDVLVDVSIGAALEDHLAFALARETPLVVGTNE